MSDYKTLCYKRQTQYEKVQRISNIGNEAKADVTKLERFNAAFRSLDISYQLCEKLSADILENIAKNETWTEAVVKQELAREKDSCGKIDNLYWTILELHSSLNGRSSGGRNNAESTSCVKLPPIPLPNFSGKLSEWNGFKQLFCKRIHNNCDLGNVEKFYHLLSSLSLEPLNMAKSIPVSDSNYPIVFKQLCDRFDNKRLLASNHWNNILNLPSHVSNNSTAIYNLLNVLNENLSVLNSLGLNTGEWGFILFELTFKKLPKNLCEKYESTVKNSSDLPSFDDLKEFLTNHCRSMESVEAALMKPSWEKPKSSSNLNAHSSKHAFVVNSVEPKCAYCKAGHGIQECAGFLKLRAKQRHDFVKEANLCVNCLKNHSVRNCKSKKYCSMCRYKHNDLLHYEKSSADLTSSGSSTRAAVLVSGISDNKVPEERKIAATATSSSSSSSSSVLLSTVLVNIKDSRGNFQVIRCLIDSGSMASFMTQKCFNKLGLCKQNVTSTITGINANSPVISNGTTQCFIKPLNKEEPYISIEAIILPRLVSNVPPFHLDASKWEHLSDLVLADPYYNHPNSIEMILGMEVFSQILKPGVVSGAEGEPVALRTSLGYIVMGKVSSFSSPTISLLTSVEQFDLRRFWEAEKVPEKCHADPDDVICEKKFVKSVRRKPDGCYEVELPFREPEPVQLGDSRAMALRRFYSLERKFSKDPELKSAYWDVIKEYLENGYLVKASGNMSSRPKNFLPHHAVWRPESSTTRLRIVYDGSALTTNNVSINQVLYAGPKLQADIAELLLLFRCYKIVLTGDIKRMFLQILIAEKHQPYQMILWRFKPEDPVEEYFLTRVTFGLTSSPYQAMRTLKKLAEDEGEKFPLAAQALSSAIYVDDFLGGADSLEEAELLLFQLQALLARGKFEMRKFASNCPHLLRNLPAEECQPIKFDAHDDILKILGLQWLPKKDCFTFHSSPNNSSPTKRSILSDVGRIWDPLGFLTPVTFFAKYLIQFLWSVGVHWDETPPAEVVLKWKQFQSELSSLHEIQIPRFLDVKCDKVHLQLHGFSDSSEKGYACCIYLRAVHFDGRVFTYLIVGKSKVAPLKKVSIPRLELCGAVLLAKTFKFVFDTFQNKFKFSDIFAWSDSTIALSWIKSPSFKWKTYVANRVSFIQEIVEPKCWKHLNSADNPADVGSRGALPKELIKHSLWWKGPEWLKLPENQWPVTKFSCPSEEVESEAAKPANFSLVAVEDSNVFLQLIKRFSSLRKIQGITVYVLRFLNICRKKKIFSGALTERELYDATIVLAKVVQCSAFSKEIETISCKKICEKTLQKLSPFLDEKGVLRVGGRLKHSQLSFEAKFPVLLPRDHEFTDLIIFSFHEKYLHPGPQTLRYLIGQQFWVLGSKRAINRCLSSCIKCFRTNPKTYVPPMGNLPTHRVSEIKPFSHCGVDMGGPFKVSMGRYRGAKVLKSYICVFICFATKAIHIELTSSLSTALRRFVARRGRVSDIYCDCGTNFVGAERQLLDMIKTASDSLAIHFHFNPPSAPHMGGLWEAAIKSIKGHISRIVGDQTLTFEEFLTLLAQVESVLNLRPLMEMSNSPNDLTALTPNHFLNMDAVSSPPDEDFSAVKMNRLSRWQLLQSFHQHIWRRWSTEYLQTLQQRQKWLKSENPPKEGILVMIKEDNLPPSKWRLGRIVELYSGSDQVVRVASVLTEQGKLKRPLIKLCPLPLQ